MPADALVAPGPRVTKQMPGLPGRLADGFGHDGRGALVAADRDLDGGVIDEGIERRQEAFARHAEHMGDAVHRQLVDQDFAAGAGAVVRSHAEKLRNFTRGQL